MTLTITDTLITSDLTEVQAEFRPHAAADGSGAWVVSDRPNRLFTEDEAVRAVRSAEERVSHA